MPLSLAKLGPAIGYPVGVAVGTLLVRTRSPSTREAWLAWASTNLANLRTHPVGSLVASAFVVVDSPIAWIVLGVVGLAATGWVLGGWRTTVLVATAHLVGTLVSQGILAYRIKNGAAPVGDRYLLDVGASYVAVCALTAGIAYGRWPSRLLCAAGFAVVAPHLFDGLLSWEVSAVGHVWVILIALALGWALRRSVRRGDPPARRRMTSRSRYWWTTKALFSPGAGDDCVRYQRCDPRAG
jgi:hypothetical protein